MPRQLKLIGFFLGITVSLCLTPTAVSAVNISKLPEVFSEAVKSSTLGELLGGSTIKNGLNTSCFDTSSDYRNLQSCLKSQCLSSDDIAQLYNLSLQAPVDAAAVRDVAPAVVYMMHQDSLCFESGHGGREQRPSMTAVWGYSFLFVTLINLCSLTGIMVLPCMKSAMYKVILMFMVALAVGTLVGSSVLVLIPEAFKLTHMGGGGGEESSQDFIWISTSIIGGIYLFFLIERFLRMINTWKENTRDKKRRDELATRGSLTSSFTRKTPTNSSLRMKETTHLHLEPSPSATCLCSMDVSVDQSSSDKEPAQDRHGDQQGDSDNERNASRREHEPEALDVVVTSKKGALIHKVSSNGHSHHGHSHHGNGQVAPVAYMVIFGDGLHNFIDGLSIGAAFTDSIMLGISVSVAVLCEELPHELGDFAILLNAGMRLRKALMYNFLSSLMCYCGLVIGILVGENTTAHTWIFGVAGGMFLYISLVDMLPEMNSSTESEDGKRMGMMRIFLLQNVGLATGYSVILLLALYGGDISFE